MYVGELGGEVAGFTAYMPWLFTDGRRTVRAVRGVDFAVAPRFRRHGVSQAIRTAASSLTRAAFIWANPNAVALRGGPKVGRSSSG
jgi:GNAT superfamily N-acetyltransferase